MAERFEEHLMRVRAMVAAAEEAGGRFVGEAKSEWLGEIDRLRTAAGSQGEGKKEREPEDMERELEEIEKVWEEEYRLAIVDDNFERKQRWEDRWEERWKALEARKTEMDSEAWEAEAEQLERKRDEMIERWMAVTAPALFTEEME